MEELLQLAPGLFQWIEAYFPREVQGIVFVAIIFLGIIGWVWWKFLTVKKPVEAAGKKFSNRKSKVRELAETIGFKVEEVERDVPKFAKGGLYTVSRQKCPCYSWPQNNNWRERWELLNRPGEYSASVGVMGWVLNGSPSQAHKMVIDNLVAHAGEPKQLLEIELSDGRLHFYWEEKGGVDGLAELKGLLDMFLYEG